jgi:hypothetical protein
MSQNLTRSIRSIHRLERSVRILELVRDRAQQVVTETLAANVYKGISAENGSGVGEAQAFLARCERAIIGAQARIDKLERGD